VIFIDRDDLGLHRLAARKLDPNVASEVDHVESGRDVGVVAEHEAGAEGAVRARDTHDARLRGLVDAFDERRLARRSVGVVCRCRARMGRGLLSVRRLRRRRCRRWRFRLRVHDRRHQ
jgi:hypothetical protein